MVFSLLCSIVLFGVLGPLFGVLLLLICIPQLASSPTPSLCAKMFRGLLARDAGISFTVCALHSTVYTTPSKSISHVL